MATVTPAEAKRILTELPRRLVAAIRRSERASLQEGLQVARFWSRGSISSAALRRMGHPYRRGGFPPQDPGIINRQTGVFLRSWRTRGPSLGGDQVSSRLFNTAPQASFLNTGTSRMIRRPIRERVVARLRPKRLARLRAAIREVLTF